MLWMPWVLWPATRTLMRLATMPARLVSFLLVVAAVGSVLLACSGSIPPGRPAAYALLYLFMSGALIRMRRYVLSLPE